MLPPTVVPHTVKVDQRMRLPINLGLCDYFALCALRLQLKNQCEGCIHPSKGPVMCERQQARARPACDYLLFQLFPSTHSCEWERKWCVCECVCWFGGGEWGCWREMETFFIPGRKRVGKRELQRNCVNVLVYVQCRWECLLFLWHSQVFFAKWKRCGRRKTLILYMRFLSGSYTQNERWSPICACPHALTPHRPSCSSYRLIRLSDTKPQGMA